jgi:hypothetical protein
MGARVVEVVDRGADRTRHQHGELVGESRLARAVATVDGDDRGPVERRDA